MLRSLFLVMRLGSMLVWGLLPAGAAECEAAVNSGSFRGPGRNGIFPATGLARSWPADGPPLLWQKNVASAWSAPCVAEGRVYLMGKNGEEGCVQAFTLEGQPVYSVVYGPEKAKELPRATPAVEEGCLYYPSNLGLLYCLKTADGTQKWSVNLNELGDTSTEVGGVSASPLLYRHLVVVSLRSAKPESPSFAAFHRQTGQLAWKGNLGPCPEAGKGWSNFHQSPILVETGKEALILNGFYRGIGAVKAESGEKAWTLPLKDPANKKRNLGMVQPLFHEGYLFLGGTLMQQLQPEGSFRTLWEGTLKVPEYNVSYSHTLLQSGRLIAFVPPALKCLDAATGQLLGSLPCGGQGSIILADGLVLLFDNRPRVALVEATDKGLQELSSFRPPFGGSRNDNFCHPVVAAGKLFLRRFGQVAVYDLKKP